MDSSVAAFAILNDIIATFPETLCPLSLCGAGKIAGADNPCP
jgi:hypothetical protein